MKVLKIDFTCIKEFASLVDTLNFEQYSTLGNTGKEFKRASLQLLDSITGSLHLCPDDVFDQVLQLHRLMGIHCTMESLTTPFIDDLQTKSWLSIYLDSIDKIIFNSHLAKARLNRFMLEVVQPHLCQICNYPNLAAYLEQFMISDDGTSHILGHRFFVQYRSQVLKIINDFPEISRLGNLQTDENGSFPFFLPYFGTEKYQKCKEVCHQIQGEFDRGFDLEIMKSILHALMTTTDTFGLNHFNAEFFTFFKAVAFRRRREIHVLSEPKKHKELLLTFEEMMKKGLNSIGVLMLMRDHFVKLCVYPVLLKKLSKKIMISYGVKCISHEFIRDTFDFKFFKEQATKEMLQKTLAALGVEEEELLETVTEQDLLRDFLDFIEVLNSGDSEISRVFNSKKFPLALSEAKNAYRILTQYLDFIGGESRAKFNYFYAMPRLKKVLLNCKQALQ